MERAGKTIAVFGSSRRTEDSAHYRLAYDLGRSLAQAGYVVLSGGYHGSMAAVSRGAWEAGGRVIGITCALFDPLQPNPWLSDEIKAPTMLERLAIMMERADGFVALRGGIGTLSELTLAWSLMQTRTYDDKPLVLLGVDWPPILETLRQHTDLGNSIASIARLAETPEDVLSALVASPTPLGPPPAG